MKGCFIILALLQLCPWSYLGPTTSASPVTAATTRSPMDPRIRNALVRRYDVEINKFCREKGRTSVHSGWNMLLIDAVSNFATGCGLECTRSLLTLDEIDDLSPSAVIKSATIKLFGYDLGSFCATSLSGEEDVTNEVLIKRILTEWNAGTVTWETQPNTTDTNAAVIPSTKPTVTYIAENTELYNFTIDITQLIRDIQASGPGNNHGIMFQMKHERRYRSMGFCSFNHPDTERHPQIIIET